jgi:hypothetical protein
LSGSGPVWDIQILNSDGHEVDPIFY